MNRRQVAQRLGKSLATVRRIEGVLLHPTRDARGIHRFDAGEVDELARGVESGSVALWKELRHGSLDAHTSDTELAFDSGGGCASCVERERQLQALSDQLNEMRSHQRLESDELARDRVKFTRERHDFENQVAEFMAAVSGLP